MNGLQSPLGPSGRDPESGPAEWEHKGFRGVIRTPIEWAAKPVQSERMRVRETRIPDVEPAIR